MTVSDWTRAFMAEERAEKAERRLRAICASVGRDDATDRADDDIADASRLLKHVEGSLDEQVRAVLNTLHVTSEALRALRIDANRVCDKLHGENRAGDSTYYADLKRAIGVADQALAVAGKVGRR